MNSTEPSDKSNENDEAFKEYLLSMRKKIQAGKEFYCDLDEAVEDELIDSMKMIYEYRKEEKQILSLAKQKDHIIDQWTLLRNCIPYFDERAKPLAFRIIIRAAVAQNAQTGCERANSNYNITKNKLSTSMKLPIIKARLRININGHPLSLFNAVPIRNLWLL